MEVVGLNTDTFDWHPFHRRHLVDHAGEDHVRHLIGVWTAACRSRCLLRLGRRGRCRRPRTAPLATGQPRRQHHDENRRVRSVRGHALSSCLCSGKKARDLEVPFPGSAGCRPWPGADRRTRRHVRRSGRTHCQSPALLPPDRRVRSGRPPAPRCAPGGGHVKFVPSIRNRFSFARAEGRDRGVSFPLQDSGS
jgi:hypothetical protein